MPGLFETVPAPPAAAADPIGSPPAPSPGRAPPPAMTPGRPPEPPQTLLSERADGTQGEAGQGGAGGSRELPGTPRMDGHQRTTCCCPHSPGWASPGCPQAQSLLQLCKQATWDPPVPQRGRPSLPAPRDFAKRGRGEGCFCSFRQELPPPHLPPPPPALLVQIWTTLTARERETWRAGEQRGR